MSELMWNWKLMDKSVEVIDGDHKGRMGHCTYADTSGHARVTFDGADQLDSVSLQQWQLSPLSEQPK